MGVRKRLEKKFKKLEKEYDAAKDKPVRQAKIFKQAESLFNKLHPTRR